MCVCTGDFESLDAFRHSESDVYFGEETSVEQLTDVAARGPAQCCDGRPLETPVC